MKYRMVDKNARDVRAELKEYTFAELKAYFEPNKEDLAEEWKKWNEVTDLFDLKWYLEYEYDGMEVPYEFEEVQTASMSFKELRQSSGMNKTEFAKHFNIPYRTVQNWEAGVSACPEYLMELMQYKLNNESKGDESMKIRKFEVRLSSIEISYKNRKAIKSGVTLEADDQEPEIIKSFDTLEEAQKELKKRKSSITRLSNHGMTYYLVEEYYIEENYYDEDGEWVEGGGDVWELSKFNIELVQKPSYNTLATFDNMEDAERACSDYDGDGEVYLSF